MKQSENDIISFDNTGSFDNTDGPADAMNIAGGAEDMGSAEFSVGEISSEERIARLMRKYGHYEIGKKTENASIPSVEAERRQPVLKLVEADHYCMAVVTHEDKEPQKASTLKKVFDKHAEETITDDQLDNILAPVLAGIEEGKYRKHRSNSLKKWFAGPIPAMAVIVALIIFVAMNTNDTPQQDVFTEISEADVPLAQLVSDETPAEKNAITGKVYFEEPDSEVSSDLSEGLAGAIIQLIRAEDGSAYSWTITDENGEFILRGFPDGVYQLRVALPSEMGVAFAAEVAPDTNAEENAMVALLMINGITDLVFDMSGDKTLEGVDIPVCRTN